MKISKIVLSVALVIVLAGNALSDDVVGWMRVSVPSNDVAAAFLPFSPLVGSCVGSLLSGPFVGDGGNEHNRTVL